MKTLSLVTTLCFFGLSFACEVNPELVQLAINVAKQEGIQPELLIAVVWVESRFCPDAVSPAGAIGLGQLMPGTAKDLGVNPFDVQENIFGAAKYLQMQFQSFENWKLALAAYNAGPGKVLQAKAIPPIEETQNYIKRVQVIYSNF